MGCLVRNFVWGHAFAFKVNGVVRFLTFGRFGLAVSFGITRFVYCAWVMLRC